jgi:hypothetical protein
MDNAQVIHNIHAYLLFFSISRIPSPQRLQNLVNYHPIFCPNIGDCSFLFDSEQCDFAGWGYNIWLALLAGSSKNSEYTWRFSWLSLPTNVR